MTSTSENAPWGDADYLVTNSEGKQTITVSGRVRWTLEELISAGERGCTPINNPAPRWSGYVHILRNLGVTIETIYEPHDGPFAGTHARYVLRSRVTLVQSDGEAA
ncbi:hypothetical protein RXV90_03210 [Rhodophyticola sp. MJ-SS7]|nr:hypothetical protein [Rhodophyticola sp. MJ-SS7]